jgi:hypothetical protein
MSSELIVKNPEEVRVELDVQINTAKAYPRNVSNAIKEAVSMATINKETAESCIYSVPRGKGKEATVITGESIRLAEILASAWGNIHSASRITENDGTTITAEGVAWDLEKNVKVCKQVKRNIKTKDGYTFGNDMQVVTGNAAQSIALRNALLSVIPRAYAKEVFKQAINFTLGFDENDPNAKEKLRERSEKFVARFEKLGIKKEKIFNYFGHRSFDEFNREDITEMAGIGTAITSAEKSLKIEKAFEFDDGVSQTKELANTLNKKLENFDSKKFKPDEDAWSAAYGSVDDGVKKF